MLRGVKDEKLLRAVERIMPIAFPLTDALFRVPILGELARFLIPVANYVEKGNLTKKQRYEEAVLDTFDMLSPKYDSPVTASEVIQTISGYGIGNYDIVSRRPVNITGDK
jgi:hypothetical protein